VTSKSDTQGQPSFKFDPRYIAPMLITCVLIGAQLAYRVFPDLRMLLVPICSAMLTEMIVGRFMDKKWPHLASAYVTGISVGIILKTNFLWPYAVCSALSILSKYVIRVKGRHPWNPSNFGISAILLLAPNIVWSLGVEFGNDLWAMAVIWLLGSVIIYRLQRFHICFIYVVAFVFFAWVRSLILHDNFITEVSPITGPPYQLFVFFMITDPKSTVHPRWAQCLVAFLIAMAESLFRFCHNVTIFGLPANLDTHAPYFALFVVGPLAVLTEIWLKERKKPAAAGQPPSDVSMRSAPAS
jgi:enediyne biosynthesis protein E5